MKYRLKTRLLETKEAVRHSVVRATVRERGARHLVLDTVAVAKFDKAAWSGDPNMIHYAREARDGAETTGTVRIDVVSDDVLRIRYAEGKSVPENVTPMVVGAPPPARKCLIGKDLTITTGKVRVCVSLDPYRLSITDRRGRKLCGIGGPEKNQFNQWDAINTGICRTLDTGAPLACESFDLRVPEAIYGLGEKFHGLNKVGQTIDLVMEDALGAASPRSYKNVPFYLSTAGYGVFFNHHSLMTFWVGSASGMDVRVAAEDDFLDYFVFCGDFQTILSRYTDLTGKGMLPPKWTFGYWQAKFTYHSAAETLAIARQLRRHQVPCDVLHLDTDWFAREWHCDMEFDPVDFPDPAGYFREMRALGFNVSLWQMPYIKEPSRYFDDLKAVDGFVKTKDGQIYDFSQPWDATQGVKGVIDFTNPRAVAVYQEYCRRVLKLGARCLKTDFGEEAPLDGVYANGRDGRHNHNLYPLLYNQAAFAVTQEVHGPHDGVVWARSAWAGNQRYPLHWGGDVAPHWEALGPQLAGGLSFGMSGFQFWSHDIGGFLGENGDPKLIVRWHQFGCLNSHARNHGCGDREIYKLPPKFFRAAREAIRLRYRLLPYILGSARQCVANSLPMLRPLVVEFPDDPTTWNIADQFLLGDSLLVAPVFTPEDRRRVYLPAGVWTDWWTQRQLTGPCWLDWENIPLTKFPLYIRQGGLIALQPVMNYIGEKPVTEIKLLVALRPTDGRHDFTVPVNDELVPVTYESRRGRHSVTVGRSGVKFSVQALGKGRLSLR